jgi:hypothetical protein
LPPKGGESSPRVLLVDRLRKADRGKTGLSEFGTRSRSCYVHAFMYAVRTWTRTRVQYQRHRPRCLEQSVFLFPHRSAADIVVERPLAHTRHVADARRPPLSVRRSMPALQALHLAVRSDSRHRTHLCEQTHLSPRRSLSTRGAHQGARKPFHPHVHGPQRVQRSSILLPKPHRTAFEESARVTPRQPPRMTPRQPPRMTPPQPS